MEPEVTKPADGMTDYGLIELSGSENTRDQGGMETVTGQRVRAKKLIRSDKLEKLTDHDIHVLVDEYELRTVIDLRTDKERELSPDPTSRMPEVKFVNLPVFTEGAVGITHEHDIRSLMKEFSQMKEDPYKIVRNIYPMALLGDEAVKAYKQFFDILLTRKRVRSCGIAQKGRIVPVWRVCSSCMRLACRPRRSWKTIWLRISSHARSFVVLRMISSICIC